MIYFLVDTLGRPIGKVFKTLAEALSEMHYRRFKYGETLQIAGVPRKEME